MSEFLPLSSNPSTTPVMLIDASQSYSLLQESVEQRLSAARGLVYSLTCMSLSNANANDVSNVAEAAYLLIEDASDLMKAARTAAMREGVRHV